MTVTCEAVVIGVGRSRLRIAGPTHTRVSARPAGTAPRDDWLAAYQATRGKRNGYEVVPIRALKRRPARTNEISASEIGGDVFARHTGA